jgi:conjugal transfer mating pair stabilization protein TraN
MRIPILRLALLLAAMLSLDAFAAKQCGIISQSCSVGPSTIVIDGMEVTRPCWQNTTDYACIEDSVSDTCGPAVAKGCTVGSTVCEQGVTINGVFQCITEQREYVCKVANASSTTMANCAGQQFCVDGNCFDTGSVPDPDFTKAVTGMEIAREAGVYIDESTFQVFKGQDNRCSKSVLKNCCKGASAPTSGLTNLAIQGGSAYLFDVLSGGGMKTSFIFGFDPTSFALSIAVMVVQQMLSCDSNEVLVAVKRDHRLCHYVGDYCSKKIKLLFASICVQHKETYCCFNSKISKIINEAARVQLPGVAWGAPENPSCQGLTIAQFQAMDLSTVDFSEFYADIKPTGPNQGDILNKAADKVNSYFGH